MKEFYINFLTTHFGLTKEQANKKVNVLFEDMTKELIKEGELVLPGIGSLKMGMTAVKESYYNPHTRAVVNEKAGGNPTVKFKMSTTLKNSLGN